MKQRYSKPFQKLIDACKAAKWTVCSFGRIRTDMNTCPIAFATGQIGLCGMAGFEQFGFKHKRDSFWTIANAADGCALTALEIKVHAALVKELKPKAVR